MSLGLYYAIDNNPHPHNLFYSFPLSHYFSGPHRGPPSFRITFSEVCRGFLVDLYEIAILVFFYKSDSANLSVDS